MRHPGNVDYPEMLVKGHGIPIGKGCRRQPHDDSSVRWLQVMQRRSASEAKVAASGRMDSPGEQDLGAPYLQWCFEAILAGERCNVCVIQAGGVDPIGTARSM